MTDAKDQQYPVAPRRDILIQTIFGLLFCFASLLFGRFAWTEYVAGSQSESLSSAGLSILFMGACFDPVNSFWGLLPFTRSAPIVYPTRFAKFGFGVMLVGGVLAAIGWLMR